MNSDVRPLRAGLSCLVAVLFPSGATLAQSMLMELRIVPQAGALPGVITNQPLSLVSVTPLDVTLAERTRRFELQYRIIDLDPSDDQVPAGLSAASINITSAVTGEPAPDVAIDRAPLTRDEARSSGYTPPGTADSSGAPLGSMSGARGMHAPFRGGFAGTPPDNANVSNGTISGLNISGITPLTLASFGQGDPTLDPTLANAWYGLYSFQITAGTDFAGFVVVTATATPDPQTGGRFGYFVSGVAVPRTSTHAMDATATLVVINIPQPASMVVLGLGAPAACRRRRR